MEEKRIYSDNIQTKEQQLKVVEMLEHLNIELMELERMGYRVCIDWDNYNGKKKLRVIEFVEKV